MLLRVLGRRLRLLVPCFGGCRARANRRHLFRRGLSLSQPGRRLLPACLSLNEPALGNADRRLRFLDLSLRRLGGSSFRLSVRSRRVELLLRDLLLREERTETFDI